MEPPKTPLMPLTELIASSADATDARIGSSVDAGAVFADDPCCRLPRGMLAA
jgi:hypothetical protein